MKNSNFLLNEVERSKGRPEYGRKLIDISAFPASNQRKSRSIWSTQAENTLLKEVLDIIKNEPDFEHITLGAIMAYYKIHHRSAGLLEGEIDCNYIPKKFLKTKK